MRLRPFIFGTLAAGTVLALLSGALGQTKPVASTAPAPSAAKKPTLAVLPFVPLTGDAREKDLAERMRFAVSQKLSSDMNAVTANGAYERMDNVKVDQFVSALEVSFAKSMPEDDDMQRVLGTLDTQFTIAGTMKGRELTLTLYTGAAKTKTATATIPPDNTSPKLAVEKVLTELTGTAFAHIRDVEADHSDAKAEARFAARPNLVIDPGFEMAATLDRKSAAMSWEVILGSEHDAPLLITATDAANLSENRVAVIPVKGTGLPALPGSAGAGAADDYCLMMRMNKEVAENNGLACESTWIPVEAGKKYRFTTLYHSTGPTARIFLKGFGEKADQFSDPKNLDSVRREFYRAQVLPRNKNAGWDLIEMDFTPSALKAADPKIQWVRVDLYVYLHAGDIYFDDVTVKKLEE